jgi:large subunit ribosomal protein L29
MQRVRDLEEERFNLNMRKSLKGLDNPLKLRVTDRDIARIRTILREDELGIRPLAKEKTTLLDRSGSKRTDEGK